jgi:hypothetical protein
MWFSLLNPLFWDELTRAAEEPSSIEPKEANDKTLWETLLAFIMTDDGDQ